MTPIIFLDIDGVLNTAASQTYWTRKGISEEDREGHTKYLCPIACSNLNFIFEQCPEARVVLCTSWRKRLPLEQIQEILKLNGVNIEGKVTDKTPYKMSSSRCEEIAMWLSEHPTEKYAIVEDAFPSDKLKENWVHCHPYNGLTYTDAEKVCDLLGVETLPIHLF